MRRGGGRVQFGERLDLVSSFASIFDKKEEGRELSAGIIHTFCCEVVNVP